MTRFTKTPLYKNKNKTMISEKDAFLLGRKTTIDLKEINAREYLASKYPQEALKNKLWRIVWIVGLCVYLATLFLNYGVNQADAYEPKITYWKLTSNSTMQPPFKIYHQLKDECYAQDVRDKEHCIRYGLSVAFAESSWKNYTTPFGLKSADKSYRKWVSSYNKYWYTATNAHFFYWDWGEYGRSHYCTEEHSSGSTYGCPNWNKNAQRVIDDLKFN